MRIRLRYGAAAGILAASFSMLGPLAQASQIPGTSVPATSHSSAVKTDVMQETPCFYQGEEYSPGSEVCMGSTMSYCQTNGVWEGTSTPC
jgi:hypothetical protein